MLHLCIDSGNTNIVFAIYRGTEMIAAWRLTSDRQRTSDEYAVWLTQLMALQKIDRTLISGAIIANVVPQTQFALEKLCRDYFRCQPLVVGTPQVNLGITIKLDNPEEVGADRLVNAVAVLAEYQVPAIVIDFGTATTFDVIDGDGGYIGGAIAPGINLSLEALVSAAARLPRIAVKKPAQIIGRKTVEAMQSGLYWGYVGLVEGMVERIQAEFGKPMHLLATGGLAAIFAENVKNLKVIDKDLTIKGLNKIYLQNKNITDVTQNQKRASA